MSRYVRAAAAALILVGVLAGCSRTTTGEVAMTTERGLTTSARTSPQTTPRIPSTRTPSTPRTPNPNAPANSLTMSCEEYNDLDEDTQRAVVDEIISQEDSVFDPQVAEVAKTLADAMCQFLPTSKVSDVLFGGSFPR